MAANQLPAYSPRITNLIREFIDEAAFPTGDLVPATIPGLGQLSIDKLVAQDIRTFEDLYAYLRPHRQDFRAIDEALCYIDETAVSITRHEVVALAIFRWFEAHPDA